MGVRGHDADEGLHRPGQDPLRTQLRRKVVQLLACWEPAEQEKIGDFFERSLFCQVADRVASVPKTGLPLVHLAEGRLAPEHSFESRAVISLWVPARIAHTSPCPVSRSPRTAGDRRAAGGSASAPAIPAASPATAALATSRRRPSR